MPDRWNPCHQKAAAGARSTRCYLPGGRSCSAGLPSQDPNPLRDAFMVRLRAEAVVGPTGLADDIARRLALHNKLAGVPQH